MFNIESWPNWLRWTAVILSPAISFIAVTIVVGLYAFINNSNEGIFGLITYFILQPGLAAFGAVYSAGYVAPSDKLYAAIYGFALIMIFVGLGTLTVVINGDYVSAIILVASVGGGWFGMRQIDFDYHITRE